MIHQAKKHRVSLRVKEALDYLRGDFQASVPETVIDSLDNIRLSIMERFEFRRIMINEKARGNALSGGFEFAFTHYLRLSHGKGPLAVILRFVGLSSESLPEKKSASFSVICDGERDKKDKEKTLRGGWRLMIKDDFNGIRTD